MLLCSAAQLGAKSDMVMECTWSASNDTMDDSNDERILTIVLPLSECVEVLKAIGMAQSIEEAAETESKSDDSPFPVNRPDRSSLWDCKIAELDIASYSKEVIATTKKDQAMASMAVICAAINGSTGGSSDSKSHKVPSRSPSAEKLICTGLLYACMVDATKRDAWVRLKDLTFTLDHSTVAASLSLFLSEPSSVATEVGLSFLDFLLDEKGKNSLEDDETSLFDTLICSLCEMCCLCPWGRLIGPQEAICKIIDALGSEWSRKYEVKLVNAALLPVKTVPRELAEAAVGALRVFIRVCSTLYGEQWSCGDVDDNIIWDDFATDEEPGEGGESGEVISPEARMDVVSEGHRRWICPSEEIFKMTVYELTSPQQLVR